MSTNPAPSNSHHNQCPTLAPIYVSPCQLPKLEASRRWPEICYPPATCPFFPKQQEGGQQFLMRVSPRSLLFSGPRIIGRPIHQKKRVWSPNTPLKSWKCLRKYAQFNAISCYINITICPWLELSFLQMKKTKIIHYIFETVQDTALRKKHVFTICSGAISLMHFTPNPRKHGPIFFSSSHTHFYMKVHICSSTPGCPAPRCPLLFYALIPPDFPVPWWPLCSRALINPRCHVPWRTQSTRAAMPPPMPPLSCRVPGLPGFKC